MASSTWKVAASTEGMTISGDRFQFTTNATDPTQLSTVIDDLRHVARDTYGQYCGLARAAEMIGERWGLLIVRDLLVGPKTFAELHWGFPRIQADVLAMRLRDLVRGGVVRGPDPAQQSAESAYELTEYGRMVEEALLALSRWGAVTLGTPRPEDVVTEDSMVMALRSAFRPAAARDISIGFELHVAETVTHVVVDHGDIKAGAGPLSDADVVIESGTVLKDMLSGAVSPADALASGQVRVIGDTALLDTFCQLFQLPAAPVPAV